MVTSSYSSIFVRLVIVWLETKGIFVLFFRVVLCSKWKSRKPFQCHGNMPACDILIPHTSATINENVFFKLTKPAKIKKWYFPTRTFSFRTLFHFLFTYSSTILKNLSTFLRAFYTCINFDTFTNINFGLICLKFSKFVLHICLLLSSKTIRISSSRFSQVYLLTWQRRKKNM